MSISDEQMARIIGDDKRMLERRIRDAYAVLDNAEKKIFGRGRFDFEGKRIESDDRRFALQWKLRKDPEAPISPDNQQTNRGDVEIVRL